MTRIRGLLDDQSPRLLPLTFHAFTLRMLDSCFTKCVARITEGELTPAEGACTDRCVFKFAEVYRQINRRMDAVVIVEEERLQAVPAGTLSPV